MLLTGKLMRKSALDSLFSSLGIRFMHKHCKFSGVDIFCMKKAQNAILPSERH